ncbi:MAG: flagellar hook-length control protein FliK [Proteobacteria bacterium]|nr:flagellar hook-length control protein FliK [Pseudomonadota bacterium]
MPPLAANTVIVLPLQKTAASALGTQLPSGIDGVFAALLARNSNVTPLAAAAKTLENLPQSADPPLQVKDKSSRGRRELSLRNNLPDAADALTPLQAKLNARKQANPDAKLHAPDGSLANPAQIANPAQSDPIPSDILAQLKTPNAQNTIDSDAKGAAQVDMIALAQTRPDVPNKTDGKTRDAGTRLARIDASLGTSPPERTAKLEEIAFGNPGDTPLPGVNHDSKSAQNHPTLDEFLAKIGPNTDQAQAVKTQIDTKATAALSELANQGTKQTASKPSIEAGALREMQNGHPIQGNDHNTQANSDQPHRDQSQTDRQNQRPTDNANISTNTTTSAEAHNQSQPQAVQTQTSNTAQTAFQNTVDASQAALPSGGTQASTVTAALQVAPRVHADAQLPQPDIGAIAVSIAAKSQSGSKRFDIRLDPPELGRIDVRLSVDGAGKAQAQLSADNQQTLDLLQRDKGTLERALKDSGLDLGSNGLNFSLKGQDRQHTDAPDGKSSRSLGVSAIAGTETANLVQPHILPVDNARLDIRV